MAKQNTNNVQPHVAWWVWFIIAVIVGFISGVLMVFSRGFYGINMEMYYAGWVVFGISVVFDILGLKALIIEANIKALEEFYGRERAVKSVNEPSKSYDYGDDL